MVTALLTGWGLPEEVAPFQLAVSELVSNALLHGSGEIHVDLSCDGDGRVRLAVGDEGGAAAAVPRVEERRIGGWGLRFVEQLAESWGAERHERGTLVWMVKRAALRGKGGGVLAW
jgi:two-component sensor histidine kinase